MWNWLKLLRIKAGLSQKELAKLVKIDLTPVGKYETGARSPTVDTAKK
jgi:transcriptional regulator with XRE-family HTH domain